jgi:pantothenate kinase type III
VGDIVLAIDVGNTNVKLGAFDGDSLVATWRLRTPPTVLLNAQPRKACAFGRLVGSEHLPHARYLMPNI